jgi:hypothetical protein
VGCRPISRGWSRRAVPELRDLAKRISRRLPEPLHNAAKKTDELRAAWRWAARCSRSWASIMSARSTGTISIS